MTNIKLILLAAWFSYIQIVNGNYCKICPDHTLCIYPVPGPSATCNYYDSSILLQEMDRENIVNKINERRNFVAIGLSRNMPQAANMKKIEWSDELVKSAQRWADQCTAYTSPDLKDHCRDLENVKVGQNIATILGPTFGLMVHSFIETWFIRVLEYNGSVTYYNQTQDTRTDYFTQLIWAETQYVGCGRAKFKNKSQTVDRLVCNFAPAGNIHAKPVYTIGYPGSQCPLDTEQDEKYVGLCRRQRINTATVPVPDTTTVTSLLRILDFPKATLAKPVIEFGDILTPANHKNTTKANKSQKQRHVPLNNILLGNINQTPIQHDTDDDWIENTDIHAIHHHTPAKGHSRIYHGQGFTESNDFNIIDNGITNPNLRKYGYSTDFPMIFTSSNYRRDGVNNQCSRKVQDCNEIQCNPTNNPVSQCTRKSHDCPSDTNCQTCPPTTPSSKSDPCTCPTQCPTTLCNPCNVPCRPNPNCNTGMYYHDGIPYGIRSVNNDDTKIQTNNDYNNYDVIPLKVFRNDDENKRNNWLQRNPNNYKSPNTYRNKIILNKDRNSYVQYPIFGNNNRDYILSTFDPIGRKRRIPDSDLNFQPFWQKDENTFKKPLDRKALRFTTLSQTRNKPTPKKTNTEPITLLNYKHEGHSHPVSEKYLSFDELLHLRKANNLLENLSREDKNHNKVDPTITSPDINSFRRQNNVNETTLYTFNTPFQRKKFCTRKITCTWTVADSSYQDNKDGNNQPIAGNRGSRTPPGYVEGCSRTSTCTRDFLERNKQAEQPEEHNETIANVNEEDDEYCERRALNVERRDYQGITVENLDSPSKQIFATKVEMHNNNKNNEAYDNNDYEIPYVTFATSTDNVVESTDIDLDNTTEEHCHCHE